MTTGALLDALIEIAGISKTAFAMDTYMAPSGLSLILTGKRLPGIKDKESFCRQAASALAVHIYEAHCYRKLTNLFPVIYDFHTQYELEAFLQRALEHTLDRDWALAHKQDLDYPDHGKIYLGEQKILNTFCIVFSDQHTRCPEDDLDIYSSLPIFSGKYPPFLRRLRFMSKNGTCRISLHQAIPMGADLKAVIPGNPLNIINALQDYCDLNFWQAQLTVSENLLLLKDRLLILFDRQLDDSWSMSVIEHKNQVQNIYEEIKTRQDKLLSFDRQQFLEKRESGQNFYDKLMQLEITDVFTFTSICYSVTEEDLAQIESSAEERRRLLAFFEKILDGNSRIYFSDLSLRAIASEGRLLVPLHGVIDIPPSERIPYLNRAMQYTLESAAADKFQLIFSSLSRMWLVCTPDLSIIYTIGHGMKNEKVHLFYGINLGDNFRKLIEDEGLEIAVFNSDLWNDFLQKIG